MYRKGQILIIVVVVVIILVMISGYFFYTNYGFRHSISNNSSNDLSGAEDTVSTSTTGVFCNQGSTTKIYLESESVWNSTEPASTRINSSKQWLKKDGFFRYSYVESLLSNGSVSKTWNIMDDEIGRAVAYSSFSQQGDCVKSSFNYTVKQERIVNFSDLTGEKKIINGYEAYKLKNPDIFIYNNGAGKQIGDYVNRDFCENMVWLSLKNEVNYLTRTVTRLDSDFLDSVLIPPTGCRELSSSLPSSDQNQSTSPISEPNPVSNQTITPTPAPTTVTPNNTPTCVAGGSCAGVR